ncbi:GNAT family N-acetyltransferase [Embleya sp. AB8]|uniref:GNAT family N-acetyltransferase n=1 Tax=Embleya sp. AB8 TaxID=3156304 RepID=UPI003C78EF13
MNEVEPRIRCFPEPATPPELRVQVVELQDQAWPLPEPAEGVAAIGPSHDPALRPLSMLLVDDDGVVVAALDILAKELAHTGGHFAVGGLSTVVTRPAARGQGHGRRLVAAAREEMLAGGFDLGLFTCDRPLRAFYEQAGWEVLPGAVLIGGTRAAPFRSDRPGFDKVTMASFFSADAIRARASFEHCDIELYPGEIDKLW